MMTTQTAGDVIAHRDEDGTVRVTIPHRHVHHSPTGLEVGDGGTGPADLALNILAAFVAVPVERDEAVKLDDGTFVSGAVWRMHQEFKWAFVATLPHGGGTIRAVDIRAWLRERGISSDAMR
jgi:hypothetical protein